MRHWWRRCAALGLILAGLGSLGCRFLDQLWDRTEGCHDTRVVLLNDEQTTADAFLVGPDEPVTETRRLHSGESRAITLCLEIGHAYPFRVFVDNVQVAVVRCPASQRQYENTTPTVAWTPVGLRCIDW
jgi:hypothetical protein